MFAGKDGLRAEWRFLFFVFGIVLGTWLVEKPLVQLLAERFGINLHELSTCSD